MITALSFRLGWMLVLPMFRLFNKLFRKLNGIILGSVIDAAINHVIIILQGHFRITQGIIWYEIRQQLKAIAVCVIGFFLAILVQNNHIAYAEAVAMEIIRAAKIKLYLEIFQNDGRIV